MNIVVVGASSGIGRSLSRYLVRQGHRVWGVARREQLLKELQGELLVEKFSYSIGDICSPEDMTRLMSYLAMQHMVPDAVVISAGVFPNDIHPRFIKENFEQAFAVNLHGVMNVVDAVLPEFEKNAKGHVVVLSSIAAFRPNRRGVGYSASKAAISLSFRGLDLAYRSKNIVFSTIYLGPVRTGMWEGKKLFFIPTEDELAHQIARVLITKKAEVYVPFFSTMLFRLARVIPDRWYSALGGALFK